MSGDKEIVVSIVNCKRLTLLFNLLVRDRTLLNVILMRDTVNWAGSGLSSLRQFGKIHIVVSKSKKQNIQIGKYHLIYTYNVTLDLVYRCLMEKVMTRGCFNFPNHM